MEEINFARHLEVKGLQLSRSSLGISLVGNAINYGMAPYNFGLKVIEGFDKLAVRLAEFFADVPFRDVGRPSKKNTLETFIAAPVPGSFAFAINFGEVKNQDQLQIEGTQDLTTPDDVKKFVSGIFDVFHLVNDSNMDELHEKIPVPAYFRNILTQIKEIAPDGNNIRMIGLSAIVNGKTETIEFTRTKSAIADDIKRSFRKLKDSDEEAETTDEKDAEAIGVLTKADSGKHKLGLASDQGNINIIVRDGLRDIVISHFEQRVKVTGVSKNNGKTIILDSIEPIEEN